MSGLDATNDSGQEGSINGLHVTAIKVHFPNGRPEGKLELAVKLNYQEIKVRVSGDTDVQWSGNIYCPLPSTVRVCIRRRRHIRWKGFAAIEVPLSLELSSLSAQRISVTFTISESTALSKVQATQEQLKNKTVLLDKLEKLRSVLTLFESAKEVLSDIHPAVGAAMSAVALLIKACERQEACRDEALELMEQLEPFLLIESRIKELKEREETRRAVCEMLHLISDVSDYICNETSSGLIGFLLGDGYQEKLGEMKKAFAKAKDDFDRSIQLEVLKGVDDTQRIAQLTFLHEKLSSCEDAHYKTGEGNACLEGTRIDLCERIVHWIEASDGQPPVLWLHGKAGSGKSTVANTIARTFDGRKYNLSCFFCKRDDRNLSDPRRVLSTLAFRFAQQHETYRTSLYQLFHTGTRGAGIAATADVDTQFEKLFKEPLMQTVEPPQLHAVIIDALDECGSPKEQIALAKCILALSDLVPWIKVFITSRDEPTIQKVFAGDACAQCNINEERGTDDDIRRYVVSQAQELEFTLSSSDASQLVRRAEGLFIWCSTLFKFLGKCHNPKEELESFSRGEEQEDSWGPLHQLYDKVLDSAAETKKDVSFTRDVLAIIAVAAGNHPLSARAIASFLRDNGRNRGCREEHVQRVVAKLHAVLYVDRSVYNAIRAYHASFYDFLQQKATEDASGWERLEATHGHMFKRCMDILNTQLRFNICKIEKPVLNKNISGLTARISENMSEELQYSSRFWFAHLSPSNVTQSDAAPGVRELLCSRKLLFWLEALSLLDSLMRYSLAFAACSSFFQGYADLVAAASDARRFVAAFSDAMKSVSHIYLSSLFWLPRDSLTYQNLELSQLTHLQLIKGKQDYWHAVIWERSVGKRSDCIAYSPNARHIACSAEDGGIYIWDAQTGTREGEPLQGHFDKVTCLSYSPNGEYIASCSHDHTVRIWSVKSGEPIFEALVGHTHWVYCVAWSPDGRFIASCSRDGTIRVWNTRTGTQEGEPLRGHDDWVLAVAYAPDGAYIVSGGSDGTIRIWRTDTYQEIGQPLCGHSDWVLSVRYSPDGHRIISGSDDHTIRIWNVQTGEAIGQPLREHTGGVNSVMYSPNGQFIVSGSYDYTVRVWDAASGAPVGGPLRGHIGSVRSVSCSPDGLFLASASRDGTVRVWEIPTSSRAPEELQGHDGPVQAVTFSPNGEQIATGSEDGTIRLWDAGTGAPIGGPPRGHDGSVTSVAYSSGGQRISSGSSDRTVRIWDAKTGEAIGEPLRGHSDWVQCVAYSSIGNLIASASNDCTVRLWDAQTGRAISEPLLVGSVACSVAFSPDACSLVCGTADGNILVWEVSSTMPLKMTLRGSGWVRSIAFSPDGRYIASGSDDKTVRLWDAQTGKPHGSVLEGHTDWVRCVAFSPDSHLVASGSDDHTVRLWDVQTELAVGDPLRGHSGEVNSVAFSPDGRSLASAGSEKRIYVYTVPSTHSLSRTRGEAESRWLECCSRMNEQDGWIADNDTLLLWTPPSSRPVLASCAHIVISKYTPRATAFSIGYETLFRYSGAAWVNVLSDVSCN